MKTVIFLFFILGFFLSPQNSLSLESMKDVLKKICSTDFGGGLARVSVYRDEKGEAKAFELMPDISRISHGPHTFYDASGKEKGAIPNRPVVKGSPEAKKYQEKREELIKGLKASETLFCRDFQ